MIDTRDSVFDRVIVDFIAAGGARVSWRYGRHFIDPGPYTSTLQASKGGTATADDWIDVGIAEVGVGVLTDSTKRVHGRNAVIAYRIKLVTPLATYYSAPARIDGLLGRRDWLLVREMVRQERLRLRVGVGIAGWLMRRRHAGTIPSLADPRTAVTDPLTGAIVRPNSPVTFGTEFTGGYFAPIPFSFDVIPIGHRAEVDTAMSRGTVDDAGIATRARYVPIPPIVDQDAFIADGSDLRYYIYDPIVRARHRGAAVVADCELRLAPYTDILYTVTVPSS